MSAPPFMKLFVGDYLADTTDLTTEEHGAYLLLLMSMWRAGGKLPRADDKLAKLARCTPEVWSSIRSTVLSFFTIRGGSIRQKRLSAELARYDASACKARKAGKASGAKRANKNNEKTLSHVEPKSNHLEPEPEEDVSQGKNPSKQDSVANATVPGRQATPAVSQAEIDRIWSVAPRIARERSSRSDLGRALRAAAQRGYRPEEILPAIQAYYASDNATKDDWRAAKGVHRLVECDRWRDWAGGAEVIAMRPRLTPEQEAAMEASRQRRALNVH